MRVSALLRYLPLFLAVAAPALVQLPLHAQFQEPTKEELQMTDDPKAPGTAAVYLNVEEVTNDPMHYKSFYARIKVLQEKGKELATVEVPFLKGYTAVTDLKARTIHPDGTVVPLVGKPEELLVVQKGEFQVERKVFNLPSVEVGSILEYRYEVRYDEHQNSSPNWEIQRRYYVHKAHYLFTPFKAFLNGTENQTNRYMVDGNGDVINTLIWWPTLPPGVEVKKDAMGRYTVDISDVPPLPEEAFMPPLQSIRYKVLFYYKNARNANEFWQDEAKRWSKEVDHFAEPSPALHEAVNQLVAPGDSDIDKAKKIYKAVQALDNTDFSRKKGETERKQLKLKENNKHAEEIWAQKSGDSEEIALLYLAMVRAAGLSANAMKVVDRERGIFDVTYLYSGQLHDTLVILLIDGKQIPVDPGEKMCPFQLVHWRHSSASGFVQSADGHFVGTTPAPAYTENKLIRNGDLVLDTQGAITGTLNVTMTGQGALNWRQTALKRDDSAMKRQFDRYLNAQIPEGVEAHVDHFIGLDDPNAPLIAVCTIKGSMGTTTAKRLMIPGFFMESRAHRPFVDEEKRQTPVDMRYGELISDQVTYHLPAGLTVESAPQNSNTLWKDHAVFKVVTKSTPGQIVIARSLARAFTFAKPEEYKELRNFFGTVATTDQAQLILTTMPPVKGN